MRFVTLRQMKPGMVLAKPIFNKNNVTLLGRNVVLTETFCRKIKDMCTINGIYVYDEYDLIDKKEFKEVVDENLRKSMVERNENFNLNAISFFSTSIVNNVQDNPNIAKLCMDISNYSTELLNHSIRVAEMATILGVGFGYANKELNNLAIAAILHDIGKTKIDKSILLKSEKLTPEDRIIVNQHPLLGYECLKKEPKIDSTTKCGVLMHHENVDGSGYPKGLKGNEIYKFAKIIHLIDVYDALSSSRTYKKAYNVVDTIEFLMANANTMFDIDTLKMFLNYIEIFKVGEKVVLSNKEIATVLENHHGYMLRPTIELNKKKIDLSKDRNYLNVVVDKKYEEKG